MQCPFLTHSGHSPIRFRSFPVRKLRRVPDAGIERIARIEALVWFTTIPLLTHSA
jgi:hypothetical protein